MGVWPKGRTRLFSITARHGCGDDEKVPPLVAVRPGCAPCTTKTALEFWR